MDDATSVSNQTLDSAPVSTRADGRPEDARAEHIEISQGGIRDAHASSISLTEGGITNATADAIDIHQGGIVRATGSDIAVSSGGIVLARGDTVSLDRGLAVGAIGGETRVVQSAANVVGGRDAIIDQSLVMSVVAERVTLRQPSAIGILVANRVDGSVRPLLDWRGGLALGIGFALVARIVRRR